MNEWQQSISTRWNALIRDASPYAILYKYCNNVWMLFHQLNDKFVCSIRLFVLMVFNNGISFRIAYREKCQLSAKISLKQINAIHFKNKQLTIRIFEFDDKINVAKQKPAIIYQWCWQKHLISILRQSVFCYSFFFLSHEIHKSIQTFGMWFVSTYLKMREKKRIQIFTPFFSSTQLISVCCIFS